MNKGKTAFNRHLNRNAGKAIVVILGLVIAILVAGSAFLYIQGQNAQEKQVSLLNSGYQAFNNDDYKKAFDMFSESRNAFGLPLKVFRAIKDADSTRYVTVEELDELSFSTCLTAAHRDFFMLKSSTEWLKKAREELGRFSSNPAKKAEFEKLVKTAESISALCNLYEEEKYEDALKKLLEAEKEASENDQDFFIFEIRLLIACGKALQIPEVITQARELLFFLSYEAGVKNDRTDKLWGLIAN